jgi:hypothetical protein
MRHVWEAFSVEGIAAMPQNIEEVEVEFEDDKRKAFESGIIDEVADFASKKELEYFTNFLGLDLVNEKFTMVVETSKRQKKFHQNDVWCSSTDLTTLPFLWCLPRRSKMHCFADLV